MGPPRLRIKMVSMGEAGCGKSALIKRFCEDRFTTKHVSTIGIDFGVKPLQLAGLDLRINIWDMAGAREWYLVRQEFYADAQGCLLVFDLSRRESFDKLNEWWQEAARHGADALEGVLVGTKVDKVAGGHAAVEPAEARRWAETRGLDYVEASSATGEGVKAALYTLFAKVLGELPGREAAAAVARTEAAAAGQPCRAGGGGSRGRRRAG